MNNPETIRKERRANGEGSIYLRGRVWWVRYSVKRWVVEKATGERKLRSVQVAESSRSAKKTDAKNMLTARLGQYGDHTMVADPRKLTYEDLRDAYLEHLEEKGSRSVRRRADGTLTFSSLPRLNSFFAGRMALSIATADCREFRRRKREAGLCDISIDRSLAALRAMFRRAVKDGRLAPAQLPPDFGVLNADNVRTGFIKDAEAERLGRLLAEPLATAFRLAYLTGMRWGEIEKLRWEYVDLLDKEIRLPGTITKNGRSRTIPLFGDLSNRLACQSQQADGLVFHLGSCRNRWHAACVAAGLGRWECLACRAPVEEGECPACGKRRRRELRYDGLRLHDLRRSAVRNMVRRGIPEVVAMQVSGHETRAVFDRYNIVSQRDLDEARTRMDAITPVQQQQPAQPITTRVN